MNEKILIVDDEDANLRLKTFKELAPVFAEIFDQCQ